jgi:hypothetical protein
LFDIVAERFAAGVCIGRGREKDAVAPLIGPN